MSVMGGIEGSAEQADPPPDADRRQAAAAKWPGQDRTGQDGARQGRT